MTSEERLYIFGEGPLSILETAFLIGADLDEWCRSHGYKMLYSFDTSRPYALCDFKNHKNGKTLLRKVSVRRKNCQEIEEVVKTLIKEVKRKLR